MILRCHYAFDADIIIIFAIDAMMPLLIIFMIRFTADYCHIIDADIVWLIFRHDIDMISLLIIIFATLRH